MYIYACTYIYIYIYTYTYIDVCVYTHINTQHHRDATKFKIKRCPERHDIIWENLGTFHTCTRAR